MVSCHRYIIIYVLLLSHLHDQCGGKMNSPTYNLTARNYPRYLSAFALFYIALPLYATLQIIQTVVCTIGETIVLNSFHAW